jgi:hypothetical protein
MWKRKERRADRVKGEQGRARKITNEEVEENGM